jgi:hypothetical protein
MNLKKKDQQLENNFWGEEKNFKRKIIFFYQRAEDNLHFKSRTKRRSLSTSLICAIWWKKMKTFPPLWLKNSSGLQ